MKEKRLKILSIVYFSAAVITAVICLWNVVLDGLFADTNDMVHGIGVIAVCVVAQFACAALMYIIARDCKRLTFSSKTLKRGLWLLAVGLFALIFTLIGQFFIIGPLLALALPILSVLYLRYL